MSRRKNEPPPPPSTSSADVWMQPSMREQMRRRAFDHLDEQDNLDAYVNAVTGIGDWNRDKTFGGQRGGPAFQVDLVSSFSAENRWRGSDLGGRVVEAIPDEMTREGFDLSIQPGDRDDEDPEEDPAAKRDMFPNQGGGLPIMPPPKPKAQPIELDDESSEQIEELMGQCEELGLDDAFWWALCYERAYGGGAILLGADDGQEDLAKPLDEGRVASIDWLNAFAGGYDGELIAWSYYRDPRSSRYGMPELYMLRNLGVPIARLPAPGSSPDQRVLPRAQPGQDALIYWVHESRLLTFPGTPVSRRARVQMRGWGDSLFTRIDKVLGDYGQTWGGLANLMQDFSQGVINVDGLRKALAGGDKASRGNPITARARQIQMTRSIARMLFLDKDETFTRVTASLTGVAEVMQQFSLRLAAAADMPIELLFGQAGGGALNKGDTTLRFFYDRIAARQRKRMLPQLKRLLRLMMLAKGGATAGVEPSRWNAKFRPLYQETALEKAQRRKTEAETDAIYIAQGVLTPEEVTASAFGGSEWSSERTVDIEGRKKMADQSERDRAAKEKVMSESARLGVQPGQLALSHPEHPSNAPPDPGKPTFPPTKE